MRILVTGASGLLGLNFCLRCSEAQTGNPVSSSANETAGFSPLPEVIGVVNRHALHAAPFPLVTADLEHPGTAARLLDEIQPQAILHCAAWANIDECEAQPERAEAINARLPGELARLAGERGIHLLHISTDAVFDGERGDYSEEDETNPLGVYARTKLHGEQAVLEANPAAAVARVNFFGWSISGKRSLAEFFFNNLSAGRAVKGFTDVYFRPLQVNDLADVLLQMTSKRLSGVYHTLGNDILSKYEFGCRLARQFGLDPSLVQPTSWKDGGLKAARSPNLTLRVDKLAAALGRPLPGVEHGLQRLNQEYQSGLPARIRGMVVES